MIHYVQKYCNNPGISGIRFAKRTNMWIRIRQRLSTRNVNFSDIITIKLQENNKIIVQQAYNLPEKVPILCSKPITRLIDSCFLVNQANTTTPLTPVKSVLFFFYFQIYLARLAVSNVHGVGGGGDEGGFPRTDRGNLVRLSFLQWRRKNDIK